MSPPKLVGTIFLIFTISTSTLADVKHVLDGSVQAPSIPEPREINYLAQPTNGFQTGNAQDFWWMQNNSPLKKAYDYYKKCSLKGNCITQVNDLAVDVNRQEPAPQAKTNIGSSSESIDIKNNPFFNGQYQSGSAGSNIKKPIEPSTGSFHSGVTIDVQKNPFFNGKYNQNQFSNTGEQISSENGFIGVQPQGILGQEQAKINIAGFLNNNKKPFATAHPLENPNKKPFATTKPGQSFTILGQNNGLSCKGEGFICVDKELCINGVINKSGEGILQTRIDAQYCEPTKQTCCKIQTIPSASQAPEKVNLHLPDLQSKIALPTGINSLSDISVGKSSVPGGTIKFEGGAGLSPGQIKVVPQGQSLDFRPQIYLLGENGAQQGRSTIKPVRDLSNSVFGSSTVDYSNVRVDDNIRFASTIQGPAYLPPIGGPTPPTRGPELIDVPSIVTYQPSVPSRPSTTFKPYEPPVVSTTFKPYVPPVTPPRPYIPPSTTQRPYVASSTTQRPFITASTTQRTYVPPSTPQRPYVPVDIGTSPSIRPFPTIGSTTSREYLPPYSNSDVNNQYLTPKLTTQHQYQASSTTFRPVVSTNSREYLPPLTSARPTLAPYSPQPSSTNTVYRIPSTTSRVTYPSTTQRVTYPSTTQRVTYPSTTQRVTYPSPSSTTYRPVTVPSRPTGYVYDNTPTPSFTLPTARPPPSTSYRPPSTSYRPPSTTYRPAATSPTQGYVYNTPTPKFEYPSSPSESNTNIIKVSTNPPTYLPPLETGESGSNEQRVTLSTSTTPRYTPTQPDYTGSNTNNEYVAARAGCAAALKCVQEIYCTADGFVSPVPVVLTKDQEANRVPTTECIEQNVVGKCCRDPNYKDPWPSANLVNGIDDGTYREDDSIGQYSGDKARLVRSDSSNNLIGASSVRNSQTVQAIHPEQPTCGERHENTQPAGLGPIDVNFAEIPWQAMILRDSNRSLLCGGAIIRENAVLTAAHCVEGLETKDVLIKGGEWKLGIDEEPLPFQIVKVNAIVRHPQYQPGSFVNDLAILVLEEKLRRSKNIGTICLPPANQIPTQNCIATGWGKRILQLHAKGALMHSIKVNVMDNQQCQQTLADKFQEHVQNYSPNTLCGFSDISQCKVDYGSALACSGPDGRYTLSGIYAWDTGCKSEGQIGGYVAPDVEWIDSCLSKPLKELRKLDREYRAKQSS